jgi:hypothetical protein
MKMKKRYHDLERRLDRQERNEESGEIRENKSEVANLPQNVSYKAWPSGGEYADYFLDDTIRGIDKQMDEDGAKMKKHLQPGKY